MKKRSQKVPLRYLPTSLSRKDKEKQALMLKKSRSLYKKHIYYNRKPLGSFKTKKSPHVTNAMKLYKVDKIRPDRELSRKTGCSVLALKRIIEKGQGAYYSSGSRPNQTAQSWGVARLASSITGGKASSVDYDIINKGCKHNKTAYRLATKSRKRYNYGRSKTKKTIL
jgi:hypothetical protein